MLANRMMMGAAGAAGAGGGYQWMKMVWTNGNQGIIAEIDLKLTSGGSDLASSGTAYAVSFYSATYTPAKAIDDNTSTFWNSTTGGGEQWWAVDLGSSQSWDYLTVAYPNQSTTNSPKNFTVLGSNNSTDGSDGDWTSIATGLAPSGFTTSSSQNFDLS